jgi:hypothetical protein
MIDGTAVTSSSGPAEGLDKMARPTPERDAAIVQAYLAGGLIHDIEREFSVSRSSLYLTLRRAGVPLRSERRLEPDSMADVIIAGLRELVIMQVKRIEELESQLEAYKKAETTRKRAARRDGDGTRHAS